MRKKYIQLPQGYLSYSQIQLWKNDPKRYIAIYMDGRDELRVTNAAMEYGKVVADALEAEKETGDLLTDASMLMLKKYDVQDQKMTVEFKTKYGWLAIVFRPDTFNSLTHAFREYKTGKSPWTYKKAQEHPQMRFYAMGIYLKFKTFLKDAYLDWIETEDSPEGIVPTGRVSSFLVTFTKEMLLKEMAETIRVAREIETVFVTHIKKDIPW